MMKLKYYLHKLLIIGVFSFVVLFVDNTYNVAFADVDVFDYINETQRQYDELQAQIEKETAELQSIKSEEQTRAKNVRLAEVRLDNVKTQIRRLNANIDWLQQQIKVNVKNQQILISNIVTLKHKVYDAMIFYSEATRFPMFGSVISPSVGEYKMFQQEVSSQVSEQLNRQIQELIDQQLKLEDNEREQTILITTRQKKIDSLASEIGNLNDSKAQLANQLALVSNDANSKDEYVNQLKENSEQLQSKLSEVLEQVKSIQEKNRQAEEHNRQVKEEQAKEEERKRQEQEKIEEQAKAREKSEQEQNKASNDNDNNANDENDVADEQGNGLGRGDVDKQTQRSYFMKAETTSLLDETGNNYATLNDASFYSGRSDFVTPMRGAILEKYGQKYIQSIKRYVTNYGVKVQPAANADVRSIADGQVIYTDYIVGTGNIIIVQHSASYYSIYGHLDQTSVTAGKILKKGDTVGKVYRAGVDDGSYLYFEIRKHQDAIDPESIIKQW